MDIMKVIASLARSADRARRLRRMSDRGLARLLLETVWAQLDMNSVPSDLVSEACDRLKRRGYQAGEPDPVSPCDCRHDRTLFVESSTGGPPHRSHHVTLCPDCGQFRVSAEADGVRIVTRFTLPTPELIRAASQYDRFLRDEETP